MISRSTLSRGSRGSPPCSPKFPPLSYELTPARLINIYCHVAETCLNPKATHGIVAQWHPHPEVEYLLDIFKDGSIRGRFIYLGVNLH